MFGATPRSWRLIAVLAAFSISACTKAGGSANAKKPVIKAKTSAPVKAPTKRVAVYPSLRRLLAGAAKLIAAADLEPRDRLVANDESCLSDPFGFGCAMPHSKKRKKPTATVALADFAVGPTVDTIFFTEGSTSFARAPTAQLDAVARIIGESEPRVLVVLGYAHASEADPESLAVDRAALIVEHLLTKVSMEPHRWKVRAQVVASPESVEPARARRVDLAFEEASPSSP